MTSRKILYILQAIEPYVPATTMSEMGHRIPQSIQEMGNEVRTFMPKWGNIKERRNQLHEVKRISGLNIIIDDTDHPLLIKVASLHASRMQVYFIDNDDFFQKRLIESDKDGVEYDDNYERAIFYARSVIETVKKQGWYPDIIHCQGWISGMAPFYLKNIYQDEPPFANTKIIFSLHGQNISKPMPDNIANLMAFRSVTAENIKKLGLELKTPDDYARLGIHYSDGIVVAEPDVPKEWIDFARKEGKPVLELKEDEDKGAQYAQFYHTVLP